MDLTDATRAAKNRLDQLSWESADAAEFLITTITEYPDGWLFQWKELIERLLAVPNIEYLKLPICTEARMEPHGTFRCSGLTRPSSPVCAFGRSGGLCPLFPTA